MLHGAPTPRSAVTGLAVMLSTAVTSSTNHKAMIDFIESDEYEAGQFQGILKSNNKQEYIPLLNLFAFPDAAHFGGCLLDHQVPINVAMEEYARQVLLCFCPFCKLEDLWDDNSYVKKF